MELERPQTTDVEQTIFHLKRSCLDSVITVNHAAEESHERIAIDWFFLNIQKKKKKQQQQQKKTFGKI